MNHWLDCAIAGRQAANLRWLAILFFVLFYVALRFPTRAHATPTAPVLLANHTERQCVRVIQGDECSWCEAPAGWEILGPASNTPCPEGYTWLESLAMECRRYEIPFCCSGFSSRGVCEDMLVNPDLLECAFVDSLVTCAIPQGWQTRPPEVEPASWVCPSGYQWAADLACVIPAQATGEAAATLQAASQLALNATQTAAQTTVAALQVESTQFVATLKAASATKTAEVKQGTAVPGGAAAPHSTTPNWLVILASAGGCVFLLALACGALLAIYSRRRPPDELR